MAGNATAVSAALALADVSGQLVRVQGELAFEREIRKRAEAQIAELKRDVNGYAVLFEQSKREIDSERSTREALERQAQARETELDSVQARLAAVELEVERWQQGVADANRISQRFEAEAREARQESTRARLDAATAKSRAEDLSRELGQARAQIRIVEAQRDAATTQRDDAWAQIEGMLPAQATPAIVPDPALDLGDEGDLETRNP